MYRFTDETLTLMRLAPVIPVLTVSSASDGLAQARALVAGGLPAIEVTMRTPAAIEAIRLIARSLPAAFVGAGTVTSPEQMQQALAAGAKFLVSPGATPLLAEAAAHAEAPFLLGVSTPSEAMALRERGFRAMKFFPAEAAGGVKMLSSIAGPLGDLVFCPTGGIDLAKAPAYLALPNVACVGGSWMVPKDALAAGDYERVETLAREAAQLKG